MTTRSIKFSAVGDVTLGDHPLCTGFGAYSRFQKEEPLFPFSKSLDALQGSDLLFGNLECAHSSVGLKKNDYHSVQMRGDPRHIQALVTAGFKVVNVANNHSLQHGKAAFQDSVDGLERNNIACCGLAADHTATSTKPVIINQNGLSVGFLGYSLRPRQYFEHVPLYAEGGNEAMEKDVLALRSQVDAVIVSLHWGEEFIQRPSPEEITIARRLVDVGADIIIGHHPHVLRGIEHYGHGYIVYSLGNFVCDMIWDDTLRTSLIFECEISAEGIRNVNLVPTYTNGNYQPEILSGEKKDAILQQMDQLINELKNNVIKNTDDMNQDYARDADTVHRHIRAKSHRFFLARFWKYPAPILAQQVGTYIKNRIHERTVGKNGP